MKQNVKAIINNKVNSCVLNDIYNTNQNSKEEIKYNQKPSQVWAISHYIYGVRL